MKERKQPDCPSTRPSVIDLFCGMGGLTLGAARAGFKVIAAVDNDPRSRRGFTRNFPGIKHIDTDIAALGGVNLLSQVGKDVGSVHGIIGGPPCQGFSRIGRRHPADTRNCLFDHFFRLVAEIRPWFYLAENVHGILDPQFEHVRREAFDKLTGYYNLPPLILKASDFGAPTNRKRVFFFGVLLDRESTITQGDFGQPSEVQKVDVRTALTGLRQRIDANWQREEQGWRALTCRPKGSFWKKVFDEVPDGVGDPDALRRLKEEGRVSGCLGTRHTKVVVKRFRSLSEGAVDDPSRAVRLKRNGFCPTLRSGTGPDRGSFQALRPIHPTESRVITPREAARLQGFPDWFVLDETKWHSFRQVGNSVSPILAETVLTIIRKTINCRSEEE